MIKKNKNKIVWLVLAFILVILSINFSSKINFIYVKEILKRKIDPKYFSILQVIGDMDRSSKKLNNDYNIKFLPETQFLDLNFKKIGLTDYFSDEQVSGYADHLKLKVRQVFYIDNHLKNIIFLTSSGKLFYNDYSEILQKKELKIINSNLDINTALDLLVSDGYMYVSAVYVKDECAYLTLYQAKISDLNNLDFVSIFDSNECVTMIQSGRVVKLSGKNSLLLATAADVLIKKNEMDDKPQNNNSIYGKILEIDLKTKEHKIFSKGHRNILGLYSDENVILSTENGPRGGDEVNKIVFNENYGWPEVSYGQKYNGTEDYPSSHSEYGYKEPIYSFIPSVGISQIIKVNKKFSNKWEDNFLVASLNGNHLFRMKFDNSYEKVFYIENIFIGERMRDLIYFEEENVFLIALETSGSLGILKP